MSKKSTRPQTDRAAGAAVSTDADASTSTGEKSGTGEKKSGRGPSADAGQQEQAPRRQDAFRETIESIVVAFILAFLFRTFEAEAFVIPTGSMAPTLLGRHKDILCDECGLSFRVGASSEVQSPYENSESGYYNPFHRLQTAYCPNCRHEMPVEDLPPFKGDRILVNKFPYEMGQPDRWDVVVFKYPENPRTNYIKRLVGLPGETLEVRQGDLYRVGESETAILRKDDPGKQLVLQQLVYDDAFPPRRLLEAGWPERWEPMRPADSEAGAGEAADGPVPVDVAGWQTDAGGWVRDAKARTFQLAGDRAATRRWLRYRHFVPDQEDWEAVRNGLPVAGNPRPRLISDFCGYNAFTSPGERETPEGLFWVGDLTVRLRVALGEAAKGSSLLLELNEGARRYRCEIDLQSGQARLFHLADQQMEDAIDENDVKLLGEAETPVRGGKTADLIFANVDNRLVLWVDGDLIDFGEGAAYRAWGDESMIQLPRSTDLIPVGIAVTGAEATVSRLRLERDVYYRADAAGPPASEEFRGSSGYLRAALSDPEEWGRRYLDGLTDPQTPGRRFVLGDDEYFMLGDNSPRSKDSRLWGNTRHAQHRHAVPATALVGKAFYIYWPHAIPLFNPNESGVARGWPQDGNSVLNNPLTRRFVYHKTSPQKYSDYPALRFPFYPNIGRMKRIR